MSGTIRDNILFSHHYDDTFYNLVLDGERYHLKSYTLTDIGSIACALRPDLALLPNGDMTEVGEKGITVRNMFGIT
jgi:ATP-binding cassette, subfamily C (CFTR/MRP), member 1